jgi:hypothetical protein
MRQKNSRTKAMPVRYCKLRDDASIASAERTIAKDFGLPAGCIRLILPNGRKARSDKDVAGLRKDWTG